ncbi:hypothetical protein Slin15195_G009460 [Septoria linicola]|uniref:Integral membrane protein, Mpv17/PMP22 family n=1 Tax=Septoria linicola TaxID=215465 RepID=A0A9Q9EFF8_9PEZI|nr:hypothetical protein Slin14017_G009470 [Septoria linicola]USW47627.1 hypothetical protein Slin15195_G009460 [Septoria linicola]
MPSQILKSTVQAGALSTLSNVLAQVISAWQTGKPVSLNVAELLQFVTFSILACPPNCVWQAWLEAQFPAHTDHLTPSEKEELVDENIHGHALNKHSDDSTIRRRKVDHKTASGATDSPGSSKNTPGRLNVKNTAIKIALDQTVGAAVNTVLFIAGIALLRGQDLPSILSDINTKFWPMIFAGQKLWPAVSILCFTVIPQPEQRMVFGSVAGLFWGVYLSLAAGSGQH